MRISTAYQFETYSRDIASTQGRYLEAQRQVSSGKRVHNPSDDPIGTHKLLSTKALKSNIEQYGKNLQTAKSFLGFSELALEESSNLTKRAYELAVRGANGSTDQPGREAIVREIEEMQRRVVDLGNSRGPNGQYIFGGHQTGSRPFTIGPGGIVFSGDDNDLFSEIGPGETMVVNTKGEAIFRDLYDKLEALKNNLSGANVGAISGVDIPALQAAQRSIDQARGTIGVKLRTVENQHSHYVRRNDELVKEITDIEDVDLSDAILSYRLAETAYSAALSVASQGFRLSLMDFIGR
jgi:flagellar hook-associated protein 3 FlgL